MEIAIPAGLCARCAHAKVIKGRISSFVRCQLSDNDSAFARYPRIPVLKCRGFEPAGMPEGQSERAPTTSTISDSSSTNS